MSILLILLPIGLTFGFMPVPYASVISRVLLLLSVSGGLAMGGTLRRVEARWILLLFLFLAASATSAAFSMDLQASLLDLGRQAYIAVFSILLVFTARHARSRKLLTQGMIFPTTVGMIAITYLYWRFGSGFSGESLRAFKGSVAAAVQNLAVNPMAGLVVLTLFLAIPALSRSKYSLWISLGMFLPVLVITGARTTIVAVPLAALLFWSIKCFSRRPKLALLFCIALVFALVFALIADVRVPASAIDDLDGVTTHRTYLWAAAWVRFCQHPWLGAGADTWLLDLPTFLPATPDRGLSEAFSQLISGAYHNAYLTCLAERGLIVFLPAILMMLFVLRSAFRLYTYRDLFASTDRAFATLAPLMVLFILVRQVAESSGLLAYATGPTDFAAFAAASLVVALVADLEGVAVEAREYDEAGLLRPAAMVSCS